MRAPILEAQTEPKLARIEPSGPPTFEGGPSSVGAHRPTPSPTTLAPKARAEHVSRALTAYNQGIIKDNPAGARAKFTQLSASPFVFFRGSAELFYRDLAGSDSNLPRVLCNGDVHPQNFGVMPSADGALIFGLNDFDEAHPAPFTWDLKRGCVGFELAAEEQGLGEKARKAITEGFVHGYLKALKTFAKGAGEEQHRFTEANSPGVVVDLLRDAAGVKRKSFLKKRVDLDEVRFSPTDEIKPLAGRVADFQAAIDGYRSSLGPDAPKSDDFFRVKDVAIKTGSGTGSIGLWRYYVLVEGESKKGKDDCILEIKRLRPSALQSHAADSALSVRGPGARVSRAHQIQLVGGDPLYGHTQLDGASYLVRERSPHKRSIDLESLSPKDFVRYAEVCGAALAQAHARGDLGQEDQKAGIEGKILKSMNPKTLPEQLRSFTEHMSAQIRHDHASFCEAHKSGQHDFPDPPDSE